MYMLTYMFLMGYSDSEMRIYMLYEGSVPK